MNKLDSAISITRITRLFCLSFFLFSTVFGGAYGARIANIKYVHDYLKKYTGITVPIKAANQSQAANVKYMLAAIDKANELSPYSAPTDWQNHPLATTQATDTAAIADGVARLFNCWVGGYMKSNGKCVPCTVGRWCWAGEDMGACSNSPMGGNIINWYYSGSGGTDGYSSCPIAITDCAPGYHPKNQGTTNPTCVRTEFDTTLVLGGARGCPFVDPIDRDVLLANADDPGAFYSCSNGVHILVSCPGNGTEDGAIAGELHFAESLQVCEWPQHISWCADSGYGNYPLTYISSGDYAENPATVCHGCAAPAAAVNGTIVGSTAADGRCQYTYTCNNGYNHELNGQTKTTNTPMTCTGCTNKPIRAKSYSYPGTYGSTGECNINITSCPYSDELIVNNGTPLAHCMPPQTKVCPGVSPLDRDILLASNSGVTDFNVCSEGTPILWNCPDGLLFNEQKAVCDWPQDIAFCRDAGYTDGEVITYSKADNPADACKCTIQCAAPTGTIQHGDVYYSPSISCQNYNCSYAYQCEIGYASPNHGAITYNNALSLNCTACTNRPGTPNTTWSYATGATSPTGCPIIISQCPNGWSPVRNGTATADCVAPNVGCPDPLPLDHTALLPVAGDCSKFWSCSDGGAVMMSCPDGLLFNAQKDVCDMPSQVSCQ